MTTLYAFDGASAFNLAAAKRAGGICATTYIRGRPGGYDHADAARVTAIRTEGMGASPNWESTADYFGTCSVTDAHWAGTDALRACRELGYPDDGTIAVSFSFDFDVPAGRYAEMGAKVRQITAGLAGHYQTMIYGQESLIVYLVVHGYITGKHWLMMSTFGQAYDPMASYFCMVQGHDINGNWIQNQAIPGTDINTVTDPYALNAWWPTGSPYSTGDDMSAADIDRINTKLDRIVDAIGQAHDFPAIIVNGDATHPNSLKAIMAAVKAPAKIDVPALATALTPVIVKAVQGAGSPDPQAIADAIVAIVGPDLAHNVVTALGEKLAAIPPTN